MVENFAVCMECIFSGKCFHWVVQTAVVAVSNRLRLPTNLIHL